jgi:WD40 repeat protein
MSATFSPDGQRVVTSSNDHTARIWDAATGKLLATLEGHGDGLRSAAFSPDGQRVVTGSADHTARLWDATTGKLLATIEGHTDVVHVTAFSPDGRHLLTASPDGTARIWDVHLETRTPVEIAAIVADKVPWKIVDGQLLPRR